MGKKTKYLSGRLFRPLSMGQQAVIISPLQIIITEPVKMICKRTMDTVIFETASTRYCVLLERSKAQVMEPPFCLAG